MRGLGSRTSPSCSWGAALALASKTPLVTTLVGPQGSDNADVLGALPAGLYSPKGLFIGSGGELFATSPTAVLVVR